MAGEEILGDGVYRVGIEDNTRAALERIRAEVRRTTEEIKGESSIVKIKGDITEYKNSMREIRALQAQLAVEEKRREEELQAAQAKGFKRQIEASAESLKNIRDLRQQLAQSLPDYAAQNAALTRQYETLKAKTALEKQAALDASRSAAANAKARAKEIEDERKLAAMQTQAAAFDQKRDLANARRFAEQQKQATYNDAAALRALANQKALMDLQAAYDRKQREIDARANLPREQRDQPSEKARIEFDDKRALIEMDIFEQRARLLGGTIHKRVELDTGGAEQKFRSFLGLGHDSRSLFDALGTSLAGLSDKIRGVGNSSGGARVNLFGMSVGMRALIVGATTLSPLLLGLVGGIGSLISVMGAGLAGAAGLGAAGLAGFGLAALGVKASLSGQIQQLTAFKQALNSYQAAQLTTGPAGAKPATPAQLAAASRRSAAIPLIDQRISIDQQAVTAALSKYGAGSLQAQRATLTLASAQQRLSNAQTGVVTTSNKTQKALDKMNTVIAQSDPAMRAAERGWLNLSSTWGTLTHTVAQRDLGQMLADGFSAANANVKWFARDTNTTLGDLAIGFHKFFADLSKPGAAHVLDNIFSNFNKGLPSILDAMDHMGAVLGRLLSNFSNYLPSFAKSFDAWARGLDVASQKADGFAGGVHTTVEAFKSFGEFVGTALRTLVTFFSLGIKPGQGLLDSATATLDRWNHSMETTGKSKAMDFFKNGATTLSEFIGLLSPLVGLIVKFATALGPALNLALGWAEAISKGVAALIQFKPAQYIVGGLALLALVTRLGRGFFDAGKAALGFGANTLRALSQVGEKGFKGAFSSNFTMSGADKILSAHKEGAAVFVNALDKAGVEVSNELRAALEQGGAAAADAFNVALAKGGAVAGSEMRAGTEQGGVLAGAAEKLGTAEGGAIAATEERAALALGGGVGVLGGAGALGGATTVAEGAAGASVLGGAKVLGKGLLKGGLIAGVGVMGSQALGGAIGGSSGKQVSNIGTGVSVGAGLGSFGGIPGAIAGGVVGGITAGIITFLNRDSRSYGKKLADGIFGDGFGGQAAANLNKHVASLLDAGNKAGSPKAIPYQGGVGRAASSAGMGNPTMPTPADLTKKAKDYEAAGRVVAEALEKGWDQYKFQSEPIMFSQIKAKIKDLPPAFQAAAAESAVHFAAGLEKNKRLPAGSAEMMVLQLESAFPQLNQFMGKTAKSASAAFVAGISLVNAEKSVKSSLDKMRGDFPELVRAMDTTKGSVEDKAAAVVKALRSIAKDGTGPAKDLAKRDLADLQVNTGRTFDAILLKVTDRTNELTTAIRTNTGNAAKVGGQNFASFESQVYAAMDAGSISTAKGVALIQKNLNVALKAFGATPIPLASLIASEGPNPLQGNAPSHGGTFTRGGRVPGPVGPDNVTLVDRTGRAIGMVGGGEILVANRHTESRVDSLLAQHGTSLSREVQGEGLPHTAPMRRYATGGIVPRFATGGTMSQAAIESVWEQAGGRKDMAQLMAAIADAESSGIPSNIQQGQPYGTTGWGLWQITPGNSEPQFGIDQAMLNPLNNAKAALAKFNSQGITAWTTYSSGAYKQFMHGGIPGSLGGGGGTAATWTPLKVPHVAGNGTISHMVQAVLDKAVKAADAYGQAHMPAPVSGGGGGAGPVFAPTSGPLPSQVQWALQAAQNIAARHLPYGHDGAGWNMGAYDCSSYVSTVMDAAGIWPKWTYYTAAGPINAHTDPGPGKYITIGTWGSSGQSAHTMMEIDGHFFESGGGGGGPHVDSGWSMNFDQYRHPRGFAMGGRAQHEDVLHKRGNPGIGHSGYQPTQAQADEIQRKSHGKPVKYAGAFAQGGSFTTNGPTVGLFGENGTETVMAVPHAATGARFHTNVAHTGPRTHGTHSSSKSPTSSHHSLHLTPAQKASKHQTALDTAEEKAKTTYDNYNYDIHHAHPAHFTGGAKRGRGHTPRLYHPGGPTPAEKAHLMHLFDAWQHAARVDDRNEPTPAFDSVAQIPAKDRIGGIGTADIQQALSNAQTAFSDFDSSMRSKTDSKGKKVKPSKKDLAHDKDLLKKQTSLQGLLDAANLSVQEFGNMETEIAILGQYMDGASASSTDTFMGYDPGMGKLPSPSKKLVKKTWSEWKAIRMYWENKHTVELKKAAADVRKRMINTSGKDKGKMDKNVYDLQYVNTLAGALATSQSDQAALAATTDTGLTLDSYIQTLPYGAVSGGMAGHGHGRGKVPNETPYQEIQRLQYEMSVAQGQVQIDNPGTPAREDITSMQPEDAAAKNIMTFYQQVFGKMKADPKTSHNYPLLTQASDAYNAAFSNWQGIDQQIVTATQAFGPSQLQINDGARAAALQAYGSNFSPVAGSPAATAGGAAAAGAFSGSPNAMTAPGNGSTVTPSGNSVNVTNNYLTQPADPHTYSQALAWELGAAI